MTATKPCATCQHPHHDHSDLVGCTAVMGAAYCTCQQFTQPSPVTPYDGGTSSGHSGTDTSAARAGRNDTDGTTAHVQDAVMALAAASGVPGLTIRELRQAMPDHHHGTLSGALSVLHKVGNLHRLTERRDRCAVYVHPLHLNGRATEQQAGRGKDNPTREQVRAAISNAYYDTRNDGGTMETAADRAAGAVMALL